VKTLTPVRTWPILVARLIAPALVVACSQPAPPAAPAPAASGSQGAPLPLPARSAEPLPTASAPAPPPPEEVDEDVSGPALKKPSFETPKGALSFSSKSKGPKGAKFVAARAYTEGDALWVFPDEKKIPCSKGGPSGQVRMLMVEAVWPDGSRSWVRQESDDGRVFLVGERGKPSFALAMADEPWVWFDTKGQGVEGLLRGLASITMCGAMPAPAPIANDQPDLVFEVAGQRMKVVGATFREKYGLALSTAKLGCGGAEAGGVVLSALSGGKVSLEGLPIKRSWKVARQSERFKRGTPEALPSGQKVINYTVDFSSMVQGYSIKAKGTLRALDCDAGPAAPGPGQATPPPPAVPPSPGQR